MKENIEVWAGIVAGMGAMFRGIKKRMSKRETIINMVVAGFLSFGVLVAVTIFIPKYVHDPRVILFITFFAGWISNDFTDQLEKFISDGYDIVISYFKRKQK